MPHASTIFPRAVADIRAAVAWRRQQSPLDGARLHAGLLAAIRSLANHPDRCPLADEATDLSLELRELLYGRRQTIYRILFTIERQTVNVLRVCHAAQDRLKPGDAAPVHLAPGRTYRDVVSLPFVPLNDPTGRRFLASEDPAPVDQNLTVVQQQTDLKYGVATINEVRSKRGLP